MGNCGGCAGKLAAAAAAAARKPLRWSRDMPVTVLPVQAAGAKVNYKFAGVVGLDAGGAAVEGGLPGTFIVIGTQAVEKDVRAGGSGETDANADTVKPCTSSPDRMVTMVTPAGK